MFEALSHWALSRGRTLILAHVILLGVLLIESVVTFLASFQPSETPFLKSLKIQIVWIMIMAMEMIPNILNFFIVLFF